MEIIGSGRKPARNWAAYNTAQVVEKADFLTLLADLTGEIDRTPQGAGRPAYPWRDVLFACIYKVYSGLSGRRFMTDLLEAREGGHVEQVLSYNTLFRYFESPQLTPYLEELIRRSTRPFAEVETVFALDASGIGTQRHMRWFDARLGHDSQRRDWRKLHIAIGVRTHIIAGCRMTPGTVHDTTQFRDLLLQVVANGFTVREVLADKGYDSNQNRLLVLQQGAQPYIPYRSLNKPEGKGEMWLRLYHYFSLRREEFDRHYHQRSNVESVFSALKQKFDGHVFSRASQAQDNETLCKIVCHNICAAIRAAHEIGLELSFAPAPVM